jgi:hypothetical protein
MNGNPGDIHIKRTLQELDLTEIVKAYLRATCGHEEQFLLHRLIPVLSGHDVEMTQAISAVLPEQSREFLRLFQQRLEEHRSSLRFRKIFSFWTWHEIEELAARRALEEMREVAATLGVTGEDNLGGLLENHRIILASLAGALLELALRRGESQADIEVIRKMLEGGKR